jgi:hypothetical protein
LPDLVVTVPQITQLPGNPPYVLEDESGHTPTFKVNVDTHNVGRAVSGWSFTQVDIETTTGQHVRSVSKRIRPLDPGEYSGKTFKVDLDFNGAPPLGLLKVVAKANQTHAFDESNTDNNNRHAKHLLPVVAHTWKASDLETSESLSYSGFPGSLMTDTTQACPPSDCSGGSDEPLTFRFSTFDEAAKHFEYVPTGNLTAGWHFNYDNGGTHCTGDTSETRGPKDWPGGFWIDSALGHYDATVDVSAEAPPAPGEIYCNGIPTLPVYWSLQDLETYIGTGLTPHMPAPGCTRLSGNHSETKVAGITTTWQWQLQAVVPKQDC